MEGMVVVAWPWWQGKPETLAPSSFGGLVWCGGRYNRTRVRYVYGVLVPVVLVQQGAARPANQQEPGGGGGPGFRFGWGPLEREKEPPVIRPSHLVRYAAMRQLRRPP